MPRIETLKQNVNMQVPNSTPIESPEAARIVGEGYSSLGKTIDGLTNTVESIYKEASGYADKIKLEKYKLFAEDDRNQATLEAQQKSTDPLGRDKVNLFNEAFKKRTESRLSGEDSGQMKAAASVAYQTQEVQGRAEFLKAAPMAAIEGVHNLLNENTNKRVGNTYGEIVSANANVYSQVKDKYLQNMAQSDAEIDASGLTFNDQQKGILKDAARQKIATTAIQAKISRGDFDGAKETLVKTAQYLGDTVDNLDKQIYDRRYQNIERKNVLFTQGERVVEKLNEQQSKAVYSKAVQDMTGMSQQNKMDYLETIKLQVPDKIFNQVESIANLPSYIKQSPLPNHVSGYLQKIINGQDVTNLIQADKAVVDGEGKIVSGIHPAVAAQIFRIQDMYQGIQNTQHKGIDQPKYQEGAKMIQDNAHLFPVSAQVDMHTKHIENTLNSKDPITSAHQILKSAAAKQTQTSRSAAGGDSILHFIYDQGDNSSLEKNRVMIFQAADQRAAKGDLVGALKIRKAFKEKSQLLNFTSSGGLNESRR